MHRFTYPVVLTPDEVDGGFVVTFPGLPEAITQGDSVEECLEEAEGALEAAVASRIMDGEDIPMPSERQEGQTLVTLPGTMALKAALYLAMKERGTSKTALARTLQVDEKQVRRMLDPHYGTKLPKLERALKALGKKVEVHVHD
jgi:antitoxin HicB